MHLFLSALDCGWNRLSEVVGIRQWGSDERTGIENGAKMITSALRSPALSLWVCYHMTYTKLGQVKTIKPLPLFSFKSGTTVKILSIS